MSTRGHCIMLLEVEMPNPEVEGVKQRGRVYVCDLAGTEPAGDIVYAIYTKVNFDDGSFEYKFDGPHADMKKTKELQEQGTVVVPLPLRSLFSLSSPPSHSFTEILLSFLLISPPLFLPFRQEDQFVSVRDGPILYENGRGGHQEETHPWHEHPWMQLFLPL